ncbi:MAG: 30S ribosomal protein S12 methylthiotransferase RimO [Thermotogota bacterium]|nr:30S ribosomal protein S12 methylthiotransferase RimO [Thermotogota bacterium]
MKVGIKTVGCAKNEADMKNLEAILSKKGIEIVYDSDLADMIIIDTCGFIEEAKIESIDMILGFCNLKKERDLKIIPIGCLVQRYYDELYNDIPEVDGLIGVTTPEKVAELINNGTYYYRSEPDAVYEECSRIDSKPYAYVKIGDGCDRQCSFCSIPLFKGKSRSRTVESIEEEVRQLVQNGTKEIVLVSQDTTQYGVDIYGNKSLPLLIKRLGEIRGEFWIRVLYLHPDHLDSDIIESLGKGNKVLPYYDVPVQSGSNKILEYMGRTRKVKELTQLFLDIRSRIPESVLRTTIMLGHPGETQDTVQETFAFIRDIEFDRLGGFVYSSEEGTKSYELPMTMSKEKAKSYMEELLEIQDEISLRRNRLKIGETFDVLVEEDWEDKSLGRSYHFAPEVDGCVYLNEKIEPGKLVKCTIKDAYEHDFEGEVLNEFA